MSDKTNADALEGNRQSPLLSAEWGNILGRLLALIIVFAFFAIAVDDG